ncbi:hypothetical protein [Natronomonas marina]|jgi:preprotein translocase subunit Sec63|uniref:hypothetical protein n=1 Tax=Natronomonas marina TaxID=2961939 RepID=UPI0020C98A58|nr:hypothetical protein [Natronomonas marina]
MEGVVFLLVGVLALVGPLVLYSLVRKEHESREEMGRREAERAARRDLDEER